MRAIDNNYGIYEGQYSNNVFNGFGRYISVDGEYYIGWYTQGARNGYGKCVETNGKVSEGVWVQGKYTGPKANHIRAFNEKNYIKK